MHWFNAVRVIKAFRVDRVTALGHSRTWVVPDALTGFDSEA